MIKDLNINGIVYAKYTIDKNILYLNPLKRFFKKDEVQSEQIMVHLISLIEETKFVSIAYSEFQKQS